MGQNKTLNTQLEYSRKLTRQDSLKNYESNFLRKKARADFRGNSLGALTKKGLNLFFHHLKKLSTQGWDGHMKGEDKWWRFHENFQEMLAEVLGCTAKETIAANTLSVNNYIHVGQFYRLATERNKTKNKIIVPRTIFPSDLDSIISRLWEAGIHRDNVMDHIIFFEPGLHDKYDWESVEAKILEHDDVALVWLEAVNYTTGQAAPLERLAAAAHEKKSFIGVDLAHAVGNFQLHLNEWKIDFATSCSYKYLNNTPGGVGIVYVNQAHHDAFPFRAGWWGHSGETRFGSREGFNKAEGVKQFLLSNDQIFNSLGLLGQLFLYKKVPFAQVEEKHIKISTYMYNLLKGVQGIQIVTPEKWGERGCQISFLLPSGYHAEEVKEFLEKKKCYCEDRGAVLRVAPVAYNSYKEVARYVCELDKFINNT